MSGISTAATIAEATAASRPMLETVKKQHGRVPNMHRLVANSPAPLKGCPGSGSRQPRYNSAESPPRSQHAPRRLLSPGAIPARLAALGRYRCLRKFAAVML